MQNKVSKEEWVAMFREIGLDDNTMKKWHQIFERKNPKGHADFLKWLGISHEEIINIRTSSK